MDVDRFIPESATFTRTVLTGKLSRWLIFILLGLPWMILSSLLQSRNVFDGTTIHWTSIPFSESALLILAGILCNFFLSGYIIRLFAGETNPPEFTNWSRLALDGIKFHTIPLVWVLVPILLGLVEYEIIARGDTGSLAVLAILLLIAIIQILILIFAVNYAIIGTVRFARTGSVREAFAIPAIKGTFDRIGIVNYYIGLGVIVLVFLFFTFILNLIALIPFGGPLITLALGPLLTVFCIRFIAHFCDEDNYDRTREDVKDTVRLRTLVPEFLVWLTILTVLVILCFTPFAVVSGAFGKILPW